VRAFETLEMAADLAEDRLDVDDELGLQIGQLLERVLERVARGLRVAE